MPTQNPDELRDEVIRRLIATPPRTQKNKPKRRRLPKPIGRLIADPDAAKKKRDKA